MQTDEPLLVMSTTCVGCVVLVPAILAPMAKLKFPGWHLLAPPPACGCWEAAGLEVPAPGAAVEAGSADEAAAEPLGVLPESAGEVAAEPVDELDEQAAAPRPTATAQSVTDVDARKRMEFPRGRKSKVWCGQATLSGSSALYDDCELRPVVKYRWMPIERLSFRPALRLGVTLSR